MDVTRDVKKPRDARGRRSPWTFDRDVCEDRRSFQTRRVLKSDARRVSTRRLVPSRAGFFFFVLSLHGVAVLVRALHVQHVVTPAIGGRERRDSKRARSRWRPSVHDRVAGEGEGTVAPRALERRKARSGPNRIRVAERPRRVEVGLKAGRGVFAHGAGPRRTDTETYLMNTSPRFPANFPSMNSSVDASCRFMYASVDTRNPLYSIPHFSFTSTCFPVSWFRKGFGFTGTVALIARPGTARRRVGTRALLSRGGV